MYYQDSRKVFKSVRVCVCVGGGGQINMNPYTPALIPYKCKVDFHVLPKYDTITNTRVRVGIYALRVGV